MKRQRVSQSGNSGMNCDGAASSTFTARRSLSSGIARSSGLTIFEDDTYGFLCEEELPPLACLAPERVFAFTSLSKSLAAGLRIGYLLAPPPEPGLRGLHDLLSAVPALGWVASPIPAEMASRWIEDGTADETVQDIILSHRAEDYALLSDIIHPAGDGAAAKGEDKAAPDKSAADKNERS